MFTLATDLKHMQVEASVDEADIGQMKDGQPVTFTVDAFPDQVFNGVVTQVRLNPILTQNVVTYTVIIAVDNPDMKLRPGMTATASILVDRRQNVLRVPTLAIRFQPPADIAANYADQKPASSGTSPAQNDTQSGDAKARWRQQGGGTHGASDNAEGNQSNGFRPGRIWLMGSNMVPRPVSVQVGLNDNRYVEIVSDELKEGDDVIIGMMATDATANNGQTNPFQQRPMGGGGGPRRGM